MAPVFGRLSKVFKGRIEFIAINTYDRPDMAKKFGVRATPTFLLIKRGKALRHFYGNIPEPLLKQHLAPYAPERAVDDAESEGREGSLLKRLRGLFGGG